MRLGQHARLLLIAVVGVLGAAWLGAVPAPSASPAGLQPPQRGLPRPDRPRLDPALQSAVRQLTVSVPTAAPQWTPLSDLAWLRATSGQLGLADRGEPRRDQAFPRRTPIMLGGQQYAKGLGTLPLSEIEYTLPPDAVAVQAVVGLNDQPAIDAGSVIFRVFGDDVELFASDVVRRGDAPRRIEVGIAGVQRLRLVVDDAGDGAVGDYAVWADAALGREQQPTDATSLTQAIAAARDARLQAVHGEEGRLQELAAAEQSVADRVLGGEAAAATDTALPRQGGAALTARGPAPTEADGQRRLALPGVRATWDEARGLLLLQNGALLLTLGVGGAEHGLLTAIDRRSAQLLFYDTTAAVRLSNGREWTLHGDTSADGSRAYRLAEQEDPLLGRGIEAAVRYRLPEGAGVAIVRLALFADQQYFTYQIDADDLPSGVTVQRYAYFAERAAGGFLVGDQGGYLADRSRIWEGPLPDDGFTRRAMLEATKPLILWNGPDQALLASVLDCVDAPVAVSFRREPGRAAAAVELRHDDVLGERPSQSPRLLVESLPSSDLRRAPANYRRIMDALYPPRPAPPWLRQQLGSWYVFGPGVDDARMREQIDYISANLNDLGPWHVVIDAGWHVAYGQADAEFRAVDYEKFPRGIRALVDYAHARDVRVVLYLPTGYVHDGRGDGEWLALPELAVAHPDWLIPIYTDGDVGRYLLDYRRPDVQAHVARTLDEALIAFDADGISIDGLADAEGQLIPLPLRQTWSGAAPIQRSSEIYALFAREIFARKPDAYVESGWVTPACARPYATTFRYADEADVFSSPYPFGGFVTHLDYAIYQTLLGQRANMGANYGDPNRADALTWLRGALALGVQATLSFDLTTMSPETLARYRAHLVHYRPFEGQTRFDATSPPRSFATRRGPITYLGVVNRDNQPRTITVSLAELGLDAATTFTAYDAERGTADRVSGSLIVPLGPNEFRLFIMRAAAGVLWTPSAFEERAVDNGLDIQVQGPSAVAGVLSLSSPPPVAVSLDGVPLGAVVDGGEGYRYDPATSLLEVRYAHQGVRQIAVHWAGAEDSRP
jgi:hypothetical protein